MKRWVCCWPLSFLVVSNFSCAHRLLGPFSYAMMCHMPVISVWLLGKHCCELPLTPSTGACESEGAWEGLLSLRPGSSDCKG